MSASESQDLEDGKIEKRKFNKRKFLEKKFDKKKRVQEWEEKRRKFAMRKYQKELKKDKVNFKETPSFESSLTKPSPSKSFSSDKPLKENVPRPGSSLRTAQLELQKKKEEKRLEKEAKLAKKKEIAEALEKYKKRKTEKFKKLSKKTKKGQPVMKERLELLYEEIKQKYGKES